LLLLPPAFYAFVFGEEFGAVRKVLLLLGPGILGLSLSTAYSHYFAGIGHYHINTIGSLLGFVVIVAGCYWLIPRHGLTGAAIAASCSYLVTSVYGLIRFHRFYRFGVLDLLPSKAEVELLNAQVRKLTG